MKKTTQDSLFHFIVLIIILVLGSAFILYFRADNLMQIYTTITLSVAYVLWGVIHHLKIGDLHLKIVTEYVLIAALGSLILLTVIK